MLTRPPRNLPPLVNESERGRTADARLALSRHRLELGLHRNRTGAGSRRLSRRAEVQDVKSVQVSSPIVLLIQYLLSRAAEAGKRRVVAAMVRTRASGLDQEGLCDLRARTTPCDAEDLVWVHRCTDRRSGAIVPFTLRTCYTPRDADSWQFRAGAVFCDPASTRTSDFVRRQPTRLHGISLSAARL